MTDFLLPIASYVIFNSISEREHNLVSEAINVLSSIAAQLKWTKYHFLLKSYLRLIPKKSNIQRNIIRSVLNTLVWQLYLTFRAIVGILNGFHFDLTKAEITNNDSEEPMELAVQDEVGQEEEMPELTEKMEEDVKLLQEGEEFNEVIWHKIIITP